MDNIIWKKMDIHSGCEMRKPQNWDRYVEEVEKRMVNADMIIQETVDTLKDQNYRCLVEEIQQLQVKYRRERNRK